MSRRGRSRNTDDVIDEDISEDIPSMNRPASERSALRSQAPDRRNADLRDNLMREFTSLQASLREEVRQQQREFQASLLPGIRESLRQDLQEHRRAVREELRDLLREASQDRGPTQNSDNPFIITSNTSHTNPINAHTVVTNPVLREKHEIKPDIYDGSTPWSRYKTHFEIAAVHNQWSNEEKAAHLATCLRGKAQLVLEKLSAVDLRNYESILKILSDKFDEKHLAPMYYNQLQIRKRTKGEDFTTFGNEIERLTFLAHPDETEQFRDKEACYRYIDGINNTEIESKLREEHIVSLQKAVQRATELLAIQHVISNKNRNFNNSNSRFHPYQQNPTSTSNPSKSCPDLSHIQCFKCKQWGHYADQCPKSTNDGAQRSSNSNHPNKNQSNTNQNFSRFRFYRNNTNQNNKQLNNTNKNGNTSEN